MDADMIVSVIASRFADLLREIVPPDQEDRWGYWAAHKAMQDDWRDRVRAALAEWDGERP